MKDGINVLSLFDGISCGQVAFQRAGIKVNKYFASEVDKYTIQVTQEHFPNTIQLGDVRNWRDWNIQWDQIDIVTGGSPCQGFSSSGLGLDFQDPKSKLFFEFLDILNHVKKYNPNVYFLLENVKMKKIVEEKISELLGVNPIIINSKLVSAQSRTRLYWTNIPNVTLPEDRGIVLQSILDSGVTMQEKSYCIDASYEKRNATPYSFILKSRGSLVFDSFENLNLFKTYNKEQLLSKEVISNPCYRKFNRTELERLQTLPEGYTKNMTYPRAAFAIGNGWTVDVITHIFKHIP